MTDLKTKYFRTYKLLLYYFQTRYYDNRLRLSTDDRQKLLVLLLKDSELPDTWDALLLETDDDKKILLEFLKNNNNNNNNKSFKEVLLEKTYKHFESTLYDLLEIIINDNIRSWHESALAESTSYKRLSQAFNESSQPPLYRNVSSIKWIDSHA